MDTSRAYGRLLWWVSETAVPRRRKRGQVPLRRGRVRYVLKDVNACCDQRAILVDLQLPFEKDVLPWAESRARVSSCPDALLVDHHNPRCFAHHRYPIRQTSQPILHPLPHPNVSSVVEVASANRFHPTCCSRGEKIGSMSPILTK